MKKERKIENTLSEYGKIPPQAVDLEEAVLGALMLERDAFTILAELLQPEYFYKDANQHIFDAISILYKKNQPIDLLTVSEQLKSSGKLEQVGGYYYISQLTSRVASSAHIEFHARIIVQKYIQRKLISICSELEHDAFDDVEDIADTAEKLNRYTQEINELIAGKSDGKHISESLKKSALEYENRKNSAHAGITTGIETGIYDLNILLGGGWKRSDLTVIAARPGMGKTALLLHFAKEAAKMGIPVCIYSLEMSDVRLANRLIQSECEIDTDRFKTGRLTREEEEQMHYAQSAISELPIYVDSNPSVSMEYIRSHSKLMKEKGQCEMILVDYLQLVDTQIRGGNRNREQEVAQASRKAKITAKELDVPFILLAQLNREVDGRLDKKPQLSDLRESGAIEQDADNVIFIYRPKYYGINTVKVSCVNGYLESSSEGVGILFIEKHRDGATGQVKFRHNKSMTRIENFQNDRYGYDR
jgi:replicative DNA helicase